MDEDGEGMRMMWGREGDGDEEGMGFWRERG